VAGDLPTPVFFAGAFFFTDLVAVFFAGAFFAGARLAGLALGPAARRSASKSEARSIEMFSTESPPRSDAFVSPSVM